jgi:hypothetical protein
MKLISTHGAGELYEKNKFLIPVLRGSQFEMGEQYGTMMLEPMETAYNVLVTPAIKKGALDDTSIGKWTERIYTTASLRYRQFYDGVVKGTGWPLEKVAMLDNLMEFSIFEAKTMDSFAGCTTIMSWGESSIDGNMYIGRNQDWSESFVQFPQVLTVRIPNDGSIKYACMGWPGILFPLTAVNEHGCYMDIHDGTSMGGSVVALERIPLTSLLSDLMAESASLKAMTHRITTYIPSTSIILSLADENGAESIECSALAGTRLRKATSDALVVVNTFLSDAWDIGPRDSATKSYSVRYPNMQRHLENNRGKIDLQKTLDLMDLKMYAADDSVLPWPEGGCTKPINQDEDVTVYQVTTNLKQRKMWLKVPVPSAFADWTEIDLNEIWN